MKTAADFNAFHSKAIIFTEEKLQLHITERRGWGYMNRNAITKQHTSLSLLIHKGTMQKCL